MINMEGEQQVCKCRCPCHSPPGDNLINLDYEYKYDYASDGMAWAQGAIRSNPVDPGPTYPHPNRHFPFGENWSNAIPATGNPFKKNSTPKAHETISNSFLHVKNMVKVMTAKWESMCESEGGNSGSKRNSCGGKRRTFGAFSHSSEQNPHAVEEHPPPTNVSEGTDNQRRSTDPFEQPNIFENEANAYSFHPTNPFQPSDGDNQYAEDSTSRPPPLPPRIPSDLLDTHSFHCSDLHGRLNRLSEKRKCSNKPASIPSGKNENEDPVISFNTIATAATVGTSEGRGSASSGSYSASPRRASSTGSSSSQGIVLYAGPNTKMDDGEHTVEEKLGSFDGDRKSVDSTGEDPGPRPQYKVETEITLERNTVARSSLPDSIRKDSGPPQQVASHKWHTHPSPTNLTPQYKVETEITLEGNNTPRSSLPGEVEEQVTEKHDGDVIVVDDEMNQDIPQISDGRRNTKENCIEIEKKSLMDVAVQTSVQKYRTETYLTLETPGQTRDSFENKKNSMPIPALGEFQEGDLPDNNSEGGGRRGSHRRSSDNKGADDRRMSIPQEKEEAPKNDNRNSIDEQEQKVVIVNSSGDEQDPVAYQAWISIPTKNNDGDQGGISSTTGGMELTISMDATCTEGGFEGDARTIIAGRISGHEDTTEDLIQYHRVLAGLSENYDNVVMTGPPVQVEPIGRSTSVTNTDLNQNILCKKKRLSCEGEKKKNVILYRGFRHQYCICLKCDKIVDMNETAFRLPGLSSQGAWHSHCFQCKLCSKPLTEKDHGFHEDEPYCLEHLTTFTGVNLPTCSGCHEVILDSSYTSAGGSAWHKCHFTCQGCQKPLTDTKYVLVQSQSSSPYCFPCHEKSFPKRCDACQKRIRPQEPYVNVNLADQGGTQPPPQVYRHSSEACLSCSTCGGKLVGRPIFFRKDNGLLYCNRYCAVR